MPGNQTKAHLALVGTNLFFAVNYTAVKWIIGGGFIKSFGLNLVRVGVSAILLWLLYVLSPHKTKFAREDYPRLFFCALSGVAINQLFFIKGLSLTSSIHAALLMLTTPLLITVFAAIVLKEAFTIQKGIGLFLGVAGAVLLITARSGNAAEPQGLLGDIFIIVNAIAYTTYFILVKPLMIKYNPVMVLRMVFTIGFVLILPFCYTQFLEIEWQSYTQAAWLNLVSIVVAGTFLAYLLNIYGLKILGASVAGAYIYSQPILAAIIAMLFLGEELTPYKIGAALLIAAGVFLATKKKVQA